MRGNQQARHRRTSNFPKGIWNFQASCKPCNEYYLPFPKGIWNRLRAFMDSRVLDASFPHTIMCYSFHLLFPGSSLASSERNLKFLIVIHYAIEGIWNRLTEAWTVFSSKKFIKDTFNLKARKVTSTPLLLGAPSGREPWEETSKLDAEIQCIPSRKGIEIVTLHACPNLISTISWFEAKKQYNPLKTPERDLNCIVNFRDNYQFFYFRKEFEIAIK
jgi:hypothetical protein